MLEIKPEEAEWMWVWDNNYRYGGKRLVIAKAGKKYLAVKDEDKDRFRQSKDYFYVKVWNYAEPIKKKLTAIVKSAEEITGVKGATDFRVHDNDGNVYIYAQAINDMAGRRIILEELNATGYDYFDKEESLPWLKNWLKDFREEE